MFADTLNCGMMDIPFTYLGLTVGANPRALVTWQSVIEKMKRRFYAWRLDGRICLINYVSTAVPLYYLSIFRKTKSSMVKWKDNCKQKEKGGLGIKI